MTSWSWERMAVPEYGMFCWAPWPSASPGIPIVPCCLCDLVRLADGCCHGCACAPRTGPSPRDLRPPPALRLSSRPSPGSDRRASQSESEPWAIESSVTARVTRSSQRCSAMIRRADRGAQDRSQRLRLRPTRGPTTWARTRTSTADTPRSARSWATAMPIVPAPMTRPCARRVRVFLIHVVLAAGFGGGSLGAGSATSSAQQ
jgi:hypothetical protein